MTHTEGGDRIINITEESDFQQPLRDSGYHVLTFAETGFAMLNCYGEQCGLDRDTIEAFSQRVNNRDESGSLHPQAPISAVPRRFIRYDDDVDTTDDVDTPTEQEQVDALAEQIEDFLEANRNHIQATKLLFDFRAGVAPFVVNACRRALESPYANGVDSVVIINE